MKLNILAYHRSLELPQYMFNGMGITTVKTVRDLGVLVSDDLKSKQQTAKARLWPPCFLGHETDFLQLFHRTLHYDS